MNRLSVFEWDRLQIGSQSKLTEAEADSLEQAAAATGRRVLVREGKSLRFRSIVGVLAARNVQVEILPKIDDRDASEADGVRHVLIDMLARVWRFPTYGGVKTSLATQRRTLLEVITALFATHLLREVARGVPRRYVPDEEDLPRLRGRMDVGRQFTRLISSPQLIACRFDELSADTPLNRLLLCAVRHLAVRVRDPATILSLRAIETRLEGVVRITPAEALAAPLSRPNRLTARLVAFEAPARHLLQAIWQSTSSGDAAGFSLLFDMNELFEAFVGVELRATLAGTGLRVQLQGPMLATLREGLNGAFHTKPDAIIRTASEQTGLVVDTKWKRLDPGQRHEGVSQADIYQMMAYMAVHTVPAALLIYPFAPFLGTPGQRRNYHERGQSITTASLMLSEPGTVGSQLKQLVKSLIPCAAPC